MLQSGLRSPQMEAQRVQVLVKAPPLLRPPQHDEPDLEIPWTTAAAIAAESSMPISLDDVANPNEAIFGSMATKANELSQRLMQWSDTTTVQARLAKGQRLDDVPQAKQRRLIHPS